MARKNLDFCGDIYAVVPVVDYQLAPESIQCPLAEGSGSLFPSLLKGGTDVDAGADYHQPPGPSAGAAGTEDKRCTMSKHGPYGHGRSCGVCGVEVRNHCTQIGTRRGNSARQRREWNVIAKRRSSNGRPTAVRTVCTFMIAFSRAG